MRELIVGIRSTAVLWVLTALIYPGLILLLGFVFPYQANGSLIQNSQGQVIGSALIGQSFTSDRYFRSRPSTTNYSEGQEAQPTGVSGASNFAPKNPDLLKRVKATVNDLQQAQLYPTADLVYTSGSSLDPHISPAAAAAQIDRIAAARSVDRNQIVSLIDRYTDHRFLSIFGEPGVNTLQLNLALDQIKS